MKTRAVVLIAVLGAFALPAASRADTTLRPSVVVTGDTIHISDLFSDAGASAGDAVAPAPALGTHATFNAAWLGTIAREHRVNWKPQSDYDTATVERASRSLGADLVGQALLTQLAPDAADGDAQIQLDNPGLSFVIPAEASDAVGIDGVTLNQHSGRFTAYVSAPANAPDAQRQRVSGRVVFQVSVAVPAHNVNIGDVLGKNDVEIVRLPRERIASDSITDPKDLIGKAAKRSLRAEQPLRLDDVQEPVVIHRGDLVTIELRTATMDLTAQGKALDDGAMGAAIRITNTQSNRVVDVTVAGPNFATIGGPAQLASN